MNKADLITNIAEKTGLSKKNSEAALGAFIEVVEESLAKGDKIQLVGFGTFGTVQRAAREGFNPITHEKIQIKSSVNPVFKVSKAFKDKLN